jgi:Lhr-like helicase
MTRLYFPHTARVLKEIGLNAKVHHSSVSKDLREVAEKKLKTSDEKNVFMLYLYNGVRHRCW